jgi:2,3-bisphosphoglycerate-independent phosphoglycerate mutase
MDVTDVCGELVREGASIVYLMVDGAGEAPGQEMTESALQAAATPNLDGLTRASCCGLLDFAESSRLSGVGPGELTLFGYDPLRWRIGCGVLCALGIDFPLQAGDVAARVDFATLSGSGGGVDRNAAPISTDLNHRLCHRVRQGLDLDFAGEVFLETESEHRAVLVLRGCAQDEDLGDELPHGDPSSPGMAPVGMARCPEKRMQPARVVADFLRQANTALKNEKPGNGLLLEGLQRYRPIPGLNQRFGLNGLCISADPTYRGLARLVGMDVADAPARPDALFERFDQHVGDGHDFYFLHVKSPDSTAGDADFFRKVALIEEVDRVLPQLLMSKPDVLVVIADHFAPAATAPEKHHAVPVLLHARRARPDRVRHFDETACLKGSLSQRPGIHLLGLALAHAGRLRSPAPKLPDSLGCFGDESQMQLYAPAQDQCGAGLAAKRDLARIFLS